MVRRFVALTPLRKAKAHAYAACLQRMWRRHFSRHHVRYMFAQRILDVRATRLQVQPPPPPHPRTRVARASRDT